MGDKKLSALMVGRLGEIAVERELLQRGWTVGNFNATVANTSAYDLFAVKGKRRVCIRVKATSGNMIQYSVKSHGSAFNCLVEGDDADFVVVVLISGVETRDFYILPTKIMDDMLHESHELWKKLPKKDGTPRKSTPHRALDFTGQQTKTIPYRGMQNLWAGYRGNWAILDQKQK